MDSEFNFIKVTDLNFSKKIKGHKKCIVLFWSKTCKGCHQMGEILRDIRMYSNWAILSADVEGLSGIIQKYAIMSLPNLLIFIDGIFKKQIIGTVAKTKLIEELKKVEGSK